MEGDDKEIHKSHRKVHSGRKAEKKKKKNEHIQELDARQRNPKAFAIQSAVKAERQFRRTAEIKTKRQHVPVIDRTPLEPPPVIVAIVGPPKVGKSTLFHCLIKNFTKQTLTNIQGPVTLVSSKKRRLTLIECNNDINVMIDVAKIADLVLLMVDAKFGFEMETFEFLNICQVHGFPRIMGVLTHLDLFKNNKQLRNTKKQLKHRFWTEIYQGAKLFYLSGMIHDEYQKTEIHNLGRFISVMKFRPLQWRSIHPYVLVDRMEDVTNPETIRQNPKCDRRVSFYGYTRGAHLKNRSSVHILGCGDYTLKDVTFLPDPCPLPDKLKKRSLNEKEKLIYAPMSGVGGIVYDKDAVYIDLGGSHSHGSEKKGNILKEEPKNELISSVLSTQQPVNMKMAESQLKIFQNAEPIRVDQLEDEENTFEELETKDNTGRVRRKVHFADNKEDASDNEDGYDNEMDDVYENDNEESEEDYDNEESDEDWIMESSSETKKMNKKKIKTKHDDDDDDDNDYENEEKEASLDLRDYDESSLGGEDYTEQEKLQWKDNLYRKASDAFYRHQEATPNLQKLVYGKIVENKQRKFSDDESDDDDDKLGGLFKAVGEKQKQQQTNKISLNNEDCSKFIIDSIQDWELDEVKQKIRDCFITGKWEKTQDAETLLQQDDEVYGDFEDFETGEKYEAKEDSENDDSNGDVEETEDKETVEKDDQEKRMKKKRKLKELFDSEYDDKDGGTSYYDDLKAELDQQTQLNKSEFESLDDELRVQYEGYRPGMYIRLLIENLPCELITNHDPNYPVVIGGLLSGEENIGFVQVRLKKHRWHKRILKTRDPFILSLGWRRFQTIPLYCMQDHNGRNRMLKYTPEHLHCVASFWGPITPQNTGFLAIQSVSDSTPDFRIAATGSVLDLDKSTQIVKKLKLTGVPLKIYKKTAFIKGMFNTALEVAKYEGASIRTVSGIRGQIKKAIRSPLGAFRATFEDKILMSDIIFLRTWVVINVPQYYNPVTSLLLPNDQKMKWQGMKTVGKLRHERGLKAPNNPDSLYKPIERKIRVFNPLVIPKSLQKDLPYRYKPKFAPKNAGNTLEKQRIAVIMEPSEQKVARLMKSLKTLHAHKQLKERKAMRERVLQHRKELKRAELLQARRQKEIKRDICKALQKIERRKFKQSQTND